MPYQARRGLGGLEDVHADFKADFELVENSVKLALGVTMAGALDVFSSWPCPQIVNFITNTFKRKVLPALRASFSQTA